MAPEDLPGQLHGKTGNFQNLLTAQLDDLCLDEASQQVTPGARDQLARTNQEMAQGPKGTNCCRRDSSKVTAHWELVHFAFGSNSPSWRSSDSHQDYCRSMRVQGSGRYKTSLLEPLARVSLGRRCVRLPRHLQGLDR